MLKYLLLLFSIFSFSQTKFSPSELSKLSFKELGKLYLEKETPLKKIVAATFLKKAKKANNHYNIVLGYCYKLELCDEDIESKKYLDSMILFSKKCSPSTNMLPFSYYRKGYFFCSKRKYNIALDNYILANESLKKTDNETLYYIIQFEIAVIKSSLFNYKQTLPIFIEYHKYCKRVKDTRNDLTAVFAIAESYNRLGKLGLSKYYSSYGRKNSAVLKDTIMYNKFKYCEAINLFTEEKFAESIVKLKSTLYLLKTDFANYSVNCFYIGKSYLAIKKPTIAIKYFKKIDSIFNKENMIFMENIPSYNYLISYYKSKNDIQKQLYYTEQLIKADSVVNSNYAYLTEKIHKEYDIPKLIKNKKILISELNGQKQLFIFAISISITVILVVVLILFRNTKKQKKILAQQLLAFENYSANQFKRNNSDEEKNAEEKKQIETIIIQDEIVNMIVKELKTFEKEKRFLQKDCTLDKLAKEMNTNMKYLSKIINDKKECTFPNYINNLRIDYGVFKLENDKQFRKYNIKGLADSLGFNNPDSFSRAFRSRMNMYPSFFMEQLRNKQL